MKRMIAELVMLLMMACSAAAWAQGDSLANLVIENQRITGHIEVCLDAGTEHERWETILVDCPLPAQPYSGEIFTTAYRRFSKKDIQRALRTIGQRDEGRFVSDGNGFRFASTQKVDPSADISKDEAAGQAVRIGISFFEALGVEVAAESAVVERPYDEVAFMCSAKQRLTHGFSQTDVLLDRQRAQWKRMHKYETRGPQYTHVSFQIMTDGMRVASWPSYPAGYADEPDARIAFDTGVSVLVSDSGALVEAQAGCIPQVKSRRMPQEKDVAAIASLQEQSLIRAESWQEALETAKRTNCLPRNTEEMAFQAEYLDEPITRYASQAVVTEIYPCLYTISKDEWVMIWQIKSRQQYADGYRD